MIRPLRVVAQLLFLLALSSLAMWSTSLTAIAPKGQARWGSGRGLYATVIRTADRRVDVQRTLAAAHNAGADRFYFLVRDEAVLKIGREPCPSGCDWESLPAFASEAQAWSITVIVYLVPPAESAAATYRPYGWDYQAWAAAIGDLARTHPAIGGMAIDDFAKSTRGDTGLPPFTPEAVASMRATLRRARPDVRLWAVLYAYDLSAEISPAWAYRPVIDGIIHVFGGPLVGSPAPPNTSDARGVAEDARRTAELASCDGQPRCWWGRSNSRDAATLAFEPIQLSGATHLVFRGQGDQAVAGREVQAEVLVDGKPASCSLRLEARWSMQRCGLPVQSGNGPARLALRLAAETVGSVGLASPAMEGAEGHVGSPLVPMGTKSGWIEAQPLPVVFMIYGTPLYYEVLKGHSVSAGYVDAVLAQLLHDETKHHVQGVVIYFPPLPGGDGRRDVSTTAAIARRFRES